MTNFIFRKTLIIGVGLIGSSIARALRDHHISSEIYGIDPNKDVIAKCKDLNILTKFTEAHDSKDVIKCQIDLEGADNEGIVKVLSEYLAGKSINIVEHLNGSYRPGEQDRTEKLISDCGNKGSVVVFNKPYEMGINKGLAELYPQYADELEAINKRMIDLLIPFRKRFLYTSEQKSSCSIKDVLPAYYPNEKKYSYKNVVSQPLKF